MHKPLTDVFRDTIEHEMRGYGWTLRQVTSGPGGETMWFKPAIKRDRNTKLIAIRCTPNAEAFPADLLRQQARLLVQHKMLSIYGGSHAP